MSKSLGNVIAPEEVIKRHGAELLRLWVAAEDYRDDVRISEEILGSSSRRIGASGTRRASSWRTCTTSTRPGTRWRSAALPDLERWALHRVHALAERCRAAYEDFEFHVVYHALNNFCSVDLSAFYLDVRKDCLYCERADAPARRATQTALCGILEVLVRVMAPILSFTAEDVWSFMPGAGRAESIFLAGLDVAKPEWRDDTLAGRFERLLAVRGAVSKAMEEARQAGTVKQSSEARIVLGTGEVEGLGALLAARVAELPTLFLAATVSLDGAETGAESAVLPGLRVQIERAKGEKCPRCWMVRTLGVDARHPEVCDRCAAVLA
jgi:isoleucyl-tRNA synthetase